MKKMWILIILKMKEAKRGESMINSIQIVMKRLSRSCSKGKLFRVKSSLNKGFCSLMEG